MAKSDKRKGRTKVPKRISGTKVPKALRKSGIAQWVLSTEGRDVIGGLLLAGATALATGKRDAVGRSARGGGSTIENAARALVGALAGSFATSGVEANLPPSATDENTKNKPRISPQ